MNSSRILYMIVFAAFFCLAFYGLQSLDFSRDARKNSGSRPIVLLFSLLAWPGVAEYTGRFLLNVRDLFLSSFPFRTFVSLAPAFWSERSEGPFLRELFWALATIKP